MVHYTDGNVDFDCFPWSLLMMKIKSGMFQKYGSYIFSSLHSGFLFIPSFYTFLYLQLIPLNQGRATNFYTLSHKMQFLSFRNLSCKQFVGIQNLEQSKELK